MDTHFPLLRIAFAAAAALFIFLIVHAALEGVFRTADVLAGLQQWSRTATTTSATGIRP